MENYEEKYWSGEESESDSRIDGNDDDDEQVDLIQIVSFSVFSCTGCRLQFCNTVV